MPIIDRVIQLCKADIHAVMDRVEDPITTLKQTLRDLEAEVDDMRQSLAEKRDVVSQFKTRSTRLEQQLCALDKELDNCIDEDELARHVIKRKLQTKRMLEVSNGHIADMEKDLQEAQSLLSQREETLLSLKQKAEILPVKSTHAEGIKLEPWNDVSGIDTKDIEIALRQERKARKK